MDTHTDTHDAALLDLFGAVHARVQVYAGPVGYAQLTAWAAALVPAGDRLDWSVEGTGCHGYDLVRHLRTNGQTVFEAPKPVSSSRRRGGKSDPIDAVHAARSALAIAAEPGARHAIPRADGHREALRILLVTRRHDTDTRTATITCSNPCSSAPVTCVNTSAGSAPPAGPRRARPARRRRRHHRPGHTPRPGP